MKNIMIVDDATTVRMFHKGVISSINRHIEEAENGVEALEKALKAPIDLFLVDINMPKMDGYRLCQEIRQRDELRTSTVIMISTESAKLDEERAYRSGANFYMSKPVDSEQLKVLVGAILGDAV
ncbi:response regulator [Alteromonas genovensis]|jgi:two-component system chemotaxis response regulator CheY|uniref:Response regulator n=1 Tax=Alteromonas genovensis TaxID=471225 RepID=A0A6N9TCG3_9ALTE|nr:response regulator [Alteromonas genovensis]NDW14132.1 response regulator [Alteromonas genovensis]